MRRRPRIDLGQEVTSEKEQSRIHGKRQRWTARNKDRPEFENPFLVAIKPSLENFGDPEESEAELRLRLDNLEFGNFPGYFNYRKNALHETNDQQRPCDTKTTTNDTEKEGGKNSQWANDGHHQANTSQNLHQPVANKQQAQQQSNNQAKEPTNASQPLEAGLSDERLALMKREWFHGKDVLDIGCNRGHVTYAIAQLYSPQFILGIDIDLKMIQMANRDLHLHLESSLLKRGDELRRRRAAELQLEGDKAANGQYQEDQDHYPLASYISQGPLAAALSERSTTSVGASELEASMVQGDRVERRDLGVDQAAKSVREEVDGEPQERLGLCSSRRKSEEQLAESGVSKSFPNNILFVEHNYVLSKDELVERQKAFFDTVVCLSVTKWIHLNYRDSGLKRFFKRIYNHLKPGGLLVLELQPFDNYCRRKKLSERLRANYYSIQFKPEHFDDYLLGPDVGFRQILYSTTTDHQCAGFKRPLKVFLK